MSDEVLRERIRRDQIGFSAADQEIAEYDGNGTLTRRYICGPGLDEPLAMLTTAGAS